MNGSTFLRYRTIKQVSMSRSNIEAGQQPAQLVAVDGKGIGAGLGPYESLLFQPFLPEGKSILVPIQDLDDGTLSIAKGKQITGKGAASQTLLYDDRQSVNRFSHVRGADSQIDLARRRPYYRRVRHSITLVNVQGLKPVGTSMAMRPSTITRKQLAFCEGIVTGTSIADDFGAIRRFFQ